MLCPNWMIPESNDLSLPRKAPKDRLLASASMPPDWHGSWLQHIPLIGKTIVSGMNASRYKTTLEQNAEFIANDLRDYDSAWAGVAVGVISKPK